MKKRAVETEYEVWGHNNGRNRDVFLGSFNTKLAAVKHRDAQAKNEPQGSDYQTVVVRVRTVSEVVA